VITVLPFRRHAGAIVFNLRFATKLTDRQQRNFARVFRLSSATRGDALMTIHDDKNANRRPLVMPAESSGNGWVWGAAFIAAALLIGFFMFGTVDRNATTANNAGPPATGPASTANNPPAGTTGSGSTVPGPGPSPSPNR
jgi:hypothetical protein